MNYPIRWATVNVTNMPGRRAIQAQLIHGGNKYDLVNVPPENPTPAMVELTVRMMTAEIVGAVEKAPS